MPVQKSFEQEMKSYFAEKGIKYTDNSSSYGQLDFTIIGKDGAPAFHLDVKEKRQKYNQTNWPEFPVPENYMFIFDDLAIRKCLAHAPNSGILVRDNIRSGIYFFSIVDLALMPRIRINRPIDKNEPKIKGKWFIDLRHGKKAASVQAAIAHIRQYLRDQKYILFEALDCYGNFVGEDIVQGGIVRQPAHWDIDVQETR